MLLIKGGHMRRFVSIAALVTVTSMCSAYGLAAEPDRHPIPDVESRSKYLEEHVIDVGDVPGHQARVYRLRYEYPNRDLQFLGVVVKESFTTGMSDYVGGSGGFKTYTVFVMEDGNKVYASGTGNTHANPDGRRSFSFTNTITGGTGPFKGLRGQMRGSGKRAAGATSLNQEAAGEYWIKQ